MTSSKANKATIRSMVPAEMTPFKDMMGTIILTVAKGMIHSMAVTAMMC